VILPHDEVDLGVLAPDDHIMVSQSGRYARKIPLSGIPQSSERTEISRACRGGVADARTLMYGWSVRAQRPSPPALVFAWT
jgi:hypothetical protein